MKTKDTISPIFNSAVEILPIMLFMIVDYFIPIGTALWIGIAALGLFIALSLFVFRNTTPYMLITTGFVMMFYLLTSVISPFKFIYFEYSTIICEVLLVLTFSIFLLLKSYLIPKARMRQEKGNQAIVVARLNEFLHVAKIVRDTLVFHLLIILIYKLIPAQYQTSRVDAIIIPDLLLVFITIIVGFETTRVFILSKKVKTEDWLPIVNETGGVIGKIALSVSKSSQKVFLHPIVRIALIYKGTLYLKARPDNFATDPNKFDYPFENYVYYEQSLDDAVESALAKGCSDRSLPVRFVFRYLFKTSRAHRLIYLYTCRINDEETMNHLNLVSGRLWSEKQIEENLGKGAFSDYFEKEYEILRDTVLMAERVVLGMEVSGN